MKLLPPWDRLPPWDFLLRNSPRMLSYYFDSDAYWRQKKARTTNLSVFRLPAVFSDLQICPKAAGELFKARERLLKLSSSIVVLNSKRNQKVLCVYIVLP